VTPPLVLVHSPSLGPRSWEPLAAELRRRGREVLVPSLLGVADDPPPAWPRVVAAVAGAVPAGERSVLVVHSNAGLFVPVIAQELQGRLAALVFVDAGLPAPSGTTAVAPPDFLDFLRGLADDTGTLPPWTRWWPEEDVAELFVDDETRLRVQAEEPRLPLSYYEQAVPAPTAWQQVPAGYVAFGEVYADETARARQLGWPVRVLPGLHLHQLVDPAAVADAVLAVTRELLPG
jgi:pimeloyl-ACP methyl ester carboxylesterase